MVKMLTVLVSTISNSQVFLLKKNVSSFRKCKSYSHFCSKNINIYAIFNDQRFYDTLTNDIVGFEQVNPDKEEVTSAISLVNLSPVYFRQLRIAYLKCLHSCTVFWAFN